MIFLSVFLVDFSVFILYNTFVSISIEILAILLEILLFIGDNMILPEIVSVGIFNSIIARKNIEISKKRKTTMFELELPIDNTGISYIDKHFSEVSENVLICAKPGQLRHTRFPFKCYFVHLIVGSGYLYDVLISLPDYIEVNDRNKYLDIFEKLNRYHDTPYENDEIILQSLVLELIYNLSRDAKKQLNKQNIGRNYAVIENAVKYIKENLTEDLSLEAISSHFNSSPIHFHNTFKVAVGTTLREYVEEQRIKKAVNMLVSTELSLTDIAFECGFSSQSYFSFVFKRRMKTTPRKYVKEVYKKYEK